MEPADLEELINGEGLRNIGSKLSKLVHKIPRLAAEVTILPITRTMLSVELALSADFEYDPAIHGSSQGFHLLVEDCDGEQILYYQYWVLKSRYANETQYVNFTVPLLDPMPPQYFLRILSDGWLKAETTLPISFRSLILPEKPSHHTELLDRQPLPLSALRQPQFEALYADHIHYLNSIQTQTFQAVYESDTNVLLAARAGSGKGLMAELAMLRLFATQPESKVVYINPVPEVCDAKAVHWRALFQEQLGVSVGSLIGDLKEDLATIAQNTVIVATPEQMDALTCKGKYLKLIQVSNDQEK